MMGLLPLLSSPRGGAGALAALLPLCPVVLFWPPFWLSKRANKYVLNCSATGCLCTASVSSPHQPWKAMVAPFFR